jgi:hypothetical protein
VLSAHTASVCCIAQSRGARRRVRVQGRAFNVMPMTGSAFCARAREEASAVKAAAKNSRRLALLGKSFASHQICQVSEVQQTGWERVNRTPSARSAQRRWRPSHATSCFYDYRNRLSDHLADGECTFPAKEDAPCRICRVNISCSRMISYCSLFGVIVGLHASWR